jgi:PcRGLX-like N-terminal RIFT barrel domain
MSPVASLHAPVSSSMMRVTAVACGAALVATAAGAQAPTKSVALSVREEAGIRRTSYPVRARVPFPSGALDEATHARLTGDGRDVPAQFAAESTWPDGSVRWLLVDFNPNLAPEETASYRLEYGPGVTPAPVARGLTVTETADAVQVGKMRFSTSVAPLVTSVNYRREDIGQGPNGLTVDAAAALQDVKLEVVARGPLLAVLRYAGHVVSASAPAASFILTIEVPSSKSWMKMSAVIEDPDRHVREVALHTPLTLGAWPWTWDFGIGSLSYGAFRRDTDSATLVQTVDGAARHWQVNTGPRGGEAPYEVPAAGRPLVAEGWGHLQSADEAVAFAIGDFGARDGRYAITLGGDGQTTFSFDAAQPVDRLELTVFEHFVSTPLAIGAATSAFSMLHPPVVFCDPAQYAAAGVPLPVGLTR